MTEYKCIILILGLLLIVFLHFTNRRKRQKTVETIQTGKDVLVEWSYSPEDWVWYAGDVSGGGWIKNRDIPGEVFITSESIYVTNGDDEYLFAFDEYKRITQCSFFHSFLDLRTEWTTSNKGQVTYHHEDFRVFVPNAQKEAVLRLVTEFKAMAQANSKFSRKFVKENEIISLFGNDD